MSVLDLIDPSFADRLITTFAHFLWQGSVVALLAVVGDRLLSRASAGRRYALHVAALMTLVACVAVTFALVKTPDTTVTATVETGMIGPASVRSVPARGAADSSGTPFTISPVHIGTETARPELPVAVAAANSVDQSPVSLLGLTGSSVFWRRLRSFAPHIAGLYFLVCGLLLARLVRGTWVAHRLRRMVTDVDNDSLLAILQQRARELGLRVLPRIAWCAEVSVPLVIGICRPLILLPVAAATGLSQDQLQALISHELAHIRRYDLVVNLAQRLVESLLFFHPAVWYISGRISSEREQACDELVLATGCERLRYADALVRMAELASSLRGLRTSASAASLAATGASSSEFKRRVLKVLSVPVTSELQPSRVSLLVIMALLAGVAVSASSLHDKVLAATPPQSSPTDTQPADGLSFLKPYPKLHALSLDMTEPQFMEIVKQQELTTHKTTNGVKETHHISLGDGHSLVVMFNRDGKCSGIQRIRGGDVAPQSFVGDIENGPKLEVLAIGTHQVVPQVWWAANGQRWNERPHAPQAKQVEFSSANFAKAQSECRELLLRVTNLPEGETYLAYQWQIDGLMDWAHRGVVREPTEFSAGFYPRVRQETPAPKSMTLRVGIGELPDEYVRILNANGAKVGADPASKTLRQIDALVQPDRVEETKGKVELILKPTDRATAPIVIDYVPVAVDKAGQKYERSALGQRTGLISYIYPISKAELDHFECRFHRYQHQITFENVSLEAGHETAVQVTVESLPELDLQGLEFLEPYPKLHTLSLDMTEPQFLEIVQRQELVTRKSSAGEKVTYQIPLGDGHSLVVMFNGDAMCSGIQRIRGEGQADSDVPPGPRVMKTPAVLLPDHWIVQAVEFDEGGKQLVTASNQSFITVRRWDLEEMKLLSEIKLQGDRHGRAVNSDTLKFSGDRRRIIAATDAYVGIWDAVTGQLLRQLPFEAKHGIYDCVIDQLDCTPDLSMIVGHRALPGRLTLSYDAHVIVWDGSTGNVLRTVIDKRATDLKALDLSTDGRRLVTTNGGDAKIWDTSTGQLLRSIPNDNTGRKHSDPEVMPQYTNHVWSVQLSPAGQQVALGDILGVKLIDVTSGKLLQQLEGPYRYSSTPSPGLVFSRDGTRLARLGTQEKVAGDQYRYVVPIWSTRTGKKQFELHTEANDATFADNGQNLAVVFSDMQQALSVWPLSHDQPEVQTTGPGPHSRVDRVEENGHYVGQKAAEFIAQFQPTWGETRLGLQYGIAFTKPQKQFRGGERVPLVAFFRNASDKPIKFDTAPDYFGNAPQVLNSTGEQVALENLPLLGHIPHYHETLEPGEALGPFYLSVGLGENPRPNQQHWHPLLKTASAGVYTLTHQVSINVPGANAGMAALKDTLASGRLEFEIVE